MKAVVQDGYGSADVLRLGELDRPPCGEREVLVRVRAAGVEPGVWHLMTGLPYLVRLFGFGLLRPKVAVRGREVAGVVEAVGGGVTRFRPGDEVFGTCESGSFAEYAAAREDRLAAKPAQLPFEQAAVTAISGVTALQAVRDGARVRPGNRVLVIGAGGGVGSFAVQVARAFGAVVTGMCSTGKLDLVRSLGADDVLDYTRTEVDCNGAWYDVVVDTAGNRPLRLLRRALAPGGTLVLVGGERAGRVLGDFGRHLLAPVASVVLRRRMHGLTAHANVDDLEDLAALVVSGAVRPVIERRYPLAQAPDAVRHVAAGHATGKVVVTI